MFGKMFLDSHDGTVSSKRVITFLAFIICSIAFLGNMLYNYKVDTNMFDSMIYLVMVGLGVTASEKFAKKPTE